MNAVPTPRVLSGSMAKGVYSFFTPEDWKSLCRKELPFMFKHGANESSSWSGGKVVKQTLNAFQLRQRAHVPGSRQFRLVFCG